jgi:hypothetical protein
MSERDITAEGDLQNIEENSALNGVYLLSLMNYLGKSTLDQVATAMYLFRFVNVTSELLTFEDKKEFLSLVPVWETNNLDTMLSGIIYEKYNSRFLSGLKELLSRELIVSNEHYIALKDEVKEDVKKLFIGEQYKTILHKSYFISKLIKEVPLDSLNRKIYQIIGGA